jgi:ribonuclease HIII
VKKEKRYKEKTNKKENTMSENTIPTFEGALSPYKFGQAVGKRPQMVYNYIKAGHIKTRTTETGKMVVDVDEMNKWAEKWLAPKEEVTEAEGADLEV